VGDSPAEGEAETAVPNINTAERASRRVAAAAKSNTAVEAGQSMASASAEGAKPRTVRTGNRSGGAAVVASQNMAIVEVVEHTTVRSEATAVNSITPVGGNLQETRDIGQYLMLGCS
jgi:hypothetical protein